MDSESSSLGIESHYDRKFFSATILYTIDERVPNGNQVGYQIVRRSEIEGLSVFSFFHIIFASAMAANGCMNSTFIIFYDHVQFESTIFNKSFLSASGDIRNIQ